MDRQSCLGKHASLRRAADIVNLLLVVTAMFLLVGAVTCSASSFPNSPANVVNVDSEYNINFSSVTVPRLGNSRNDGAVSRRSLGTSCPIDPTGRPNCPPACQTDRGSCSGG